MKIEDVKKKKEFIGSVFFAVSVILAFLIAAKVAGFCVVSVNAGSAVERAIGQFKPNDKNVKSQLDKARIIADDLKKQNLFCPPAPRQNPVKEVLGILGDEALINGKWYKAGDKVGDARVVAIKSTSVTVEWDGRRKVFSPIDAVTSTGPSRPSRPRRTMSVSSTQGPAQMVVTQSTPTAKHSSTDANVVKKMKKKHDGMSEEQRDKFKKIMAKSKEEYKKMSDAERARFKADLIKKLGGSNGR